MQREHSNNNNLSASKFQNPIYLETPRLRKFYETTLTSIDSCSPLLGSSRPLILQNLLQSDCKCNPLSRINLSNAKLQKALMDPLGEIELNHSDGKTCLEDDNEEIGVGLLGVSQDINKKYAQTTVKQYQQQKQQLIQQQQQQQQQQQLSQTQSSQQNPKKIFEIYHCHSSNNNSTNINNNIKQKEEYERTGELNELSDQMMLLEEGNSELLKNEAKKRMRKSNQQLKILKVEFDKSGFWGKDKITAVANITGLSESQVYKWCWDQKKKQVDVDCDSITKKIFKSKYKSNKIFQYKQQLEEFNQSSNDHQIYNDQEQAVSKKLSFE